MDLPVRTPSAQGSHTPEPECSVPLLNTPNNPGSAQEANLANLKEQPKSPQGTKGHANNNPSSPLSSLPSSSQNSIPNTVAEKCPIESKAAPESDARKDSKTTLSDKSEIEPGSKDSDLATMSGTGKKRSRKDDEDQDVDTKPTPAKKTASKRAPAKKKAPPPPPTPSNRPTRNRKAPARLVEQQQEDPKPKATPKGPAGKVFDPIYITTNSNSRLGKADIYHLLLESSAWDVLTSTDQAELISMLPPTDANVSLLGQAQDGNKVARPKELSACEIFRTDVAKFQEDLRNGHLAKGWQNQAKQAIVDRKDGLFDEWKQSETEAWWGQKMR